MGVQVHSARTHLEERDWRQAVARGLRGRCPHCGKFVAARRASTEQLDAAERRFRSAPEEQPLVKSDQEKKQESYDDSKFTEL